MAVPDTFSIPADKPEVKLVLVDLDGTLLDTQSHPTPQNLAALRALSERGITCGIASGRDVYSIEKLVDSWGAHDIIDLVVGQNGSEVHQVSTGELKTGYLVDPEVFRRVIDHFADFDLNFCIAQKGIYQCYRDDRFVVNLEKIGRFEVGVDPEFKQLLQSPQAKLHIMCEPALMPQVIERAASLNEPEVQGVRTGPYLFEFQHPKVSKAVGIELARELLGLPSEAAVMAFGDAENDLEMIAAATVGVAMANACPAVKEVANYQTLDNNQSGVAVFLNQWFGLD
ncbi:Cof-type HAD-IIB family hydrolase [Boudabousia liubingyangii]|uniref:Cof-type HAD-IIB family hydrolase n=1 Tax=Boudabousia liubingyangii TaxID=1921764 RepID=UPI000AA5D9AD|nr:Cof-type HAD-IIB family hydrolase [Boudabousia liubingyangii]